MRSAEQIEQRLLDDGLEGWLCAENLTDGRRLSYRDDQDVVMASLYKLPVLIAFAHEWAAGRLDPAEQIRLEPAALTAGVTGLGTLTDPVTTSLRNLAVLMATVSDDAAADVVLDAVGLPAVNALLDRAGVARTRVLSGSSQSHQRLLRQTQVATLPGAFERLASNDELYGDRVYDPALTSPTTARDMVRLLGALWRGELLPIEQQRFVQRTLRSQIWPHRLRAGFPYSTVAVAGKTGTLGALRHEVGVIELPHEPPYAVAVLTRAARADAVLPAADRAIGALAQLAVSELRAQI